MRDLSLVYSILLVAFAGVGAIMARNKDVRILTGCILGFFFGPLGFIGIAMIAEARKLKKPQN